MGSRVTGVHYWQLCPCCPCQIDQRGSQHSQWGRWHQEDRVHMKINLPVFIGKDAKDAVTYQSWRWDLTMYQHAGCRDAIQSLQGYLNELVQSSGMDITLDDMLTILDEHYNNVKALEALNQELFQLRMVDKEHCIGLSCPPFQTSPGSSCFLPSLLSPWLSGRVEEIPLLWQASQATKSNGGLPKGRPTGKDLLWLPKGHLGSGERRFPWSFPGAQGLRQPAILPNHGLPVFSPCRNSRATSPPQRCQLCIWHIWRKRMLGVMKMMEVMILAESKGLLKSLQCAWQGL